MYLVSILVPIYGVEKYIERCARSVFDQTYPNLEFVFCNDATPDRSVEILEHVIEDYPHLQERIHILHHDHNRGIAATRNNLFDHCTGEYLTYVDSDDWIEPDMVEKLVKKQKETDADIVTGRYYRHHHDEVYEGNLKKIGILKKNDKEEMLKAMLEFSSSVALWNRLIRSSLYREHNIQCVEGVNAGEDLLVMPRLVYYSQKVAFCDAITYHYDRSNFNSHANVVSHNWDMQQQLIRATLLNVEFFKDKEACFSKAMDKQLVERLKKTLGLTFHNHNNQGYHHVLSLLDNTDSRDWSLIGWDNPKKRWLDHHYYLTRLSLPLRRLHRTLHQLSHKSPEQP